MSETQPVSNDNPLTISIPLLNGEKEISIEKSLVVVGANGSGKTRLGAWIDLDPRYAESTHRISAQKSIAIPKTSSIENAENAHRIFFTSDRHKSLTAPTQQLKISLRWAKNPVTQYLQDYDSLLNYLFSEATQTAVEYHQGRSSESIKSADEVPSTKLNAIKKTWETLLPQRSLKINSASIQTSIKDKPGEMYHASDMSDGERVIFYLIGACLSAPKNALIIIDEPELHLHKAIQMPLWDVIENSRPDCKFIYITHDLDFAAQKRSAKKIWLKSYDGKQWDWELIDPIDGFPDELLMQILGSKKPIIFVEGDKSSYDTELYQILLKDYSIIPVGGCTKVIETVKGLNEAKQLHQFSIYGIIDRDRRTNAEIEALKNHNIYTLDVAEVESLFCTEAIIELVADHMRHNARKAQGKVEAFIFEELEKELEHQISLHCAHEIKFLLSNFEQNVRDKSDTLKNYAETINEINVDEVFSRFQDRFNEIVKAKDYSTLFKTYNRKALANRISPILGLKEKEFPKLALRLMRESDDIESISEALLPSFKEFIANTQQQKITEKAESPNNG